MTSMPELPEVETVRRGLQPAMEGSKIVRAEARGKELRFPFQRGFVARLVRRHRDGVRRDADELGHFLHGLLVVVDKIDDLPVFRRQRREALTQRYTGILLRYRHFRIVGGVLDRLGS